MRDEDIYDKMEQMVGLFQRIAFKLSDIGEALNEDRIEVAMYNLGLAHAMAEHCHKEARDVFMKALAMRGMKEGEE